MKQTHILVLCNFYISNLVAKTNYAIEIWGDGEVIRDYIYIKDAVNVLVRSLEISSKEKVFNLSTGKGYSLNEIIDVIRKISGQKISPEY